jgi:hypothetical protein
MKRLLRFVATLILGYLVLLVTAWWSDQNPNVAAIFGGHNIVLQIFITLPLIFFFLGTLPIFREKSSGQKSQ